MNKKIIKFSCLNNQLLLAVIACLAAASLFFSGFQFAAENILDKYFEQSKYLSKQTDKTAAEFQDFVTSNSLSTTDSTQMAEWVKEQRIVIIYISVDNKKIFDSTSYSTPYNGYYSYAEISDWFTTYKITFSDTTAKVHLFGFFDYQAYTYADYGGILLSCFLFIALLTFLIHHKLSYINQLKYEIQILEGGNLEYAITVRGKDELASLANSLNTMRLSFIEQIEAEKNAQLANKELVTALSHDLRTPLTTLMGYLEIVKEKHWTTDEQRNQYLDKCIVTCNQIKQMSNRLFEYFLIYNLDNTSQDITLEDFDGLEIFMQLISEKTVLLEEKGFHFLIETPLESFGVKIQTNYFCRIFDNIFSNIEKYASIETPISISIRTENDHCIMTFNNAIKKNPFNIEGTKIGLKSTCRLMEQQEGSCYYIDDKEFFLLILSLPCFPIE